MFQPADPTARRRRLFLVAVAALLVLLIALAVALVRSNGNGPPSATATTTSVLQGSFSKTTMTCPHQHELVGDTCTIPLHLSTGRVVVTVTWPGNTLIAMGIRDQSGRDLGPQITGDHGRAVFDTTKFGATRGPAVSASGAVPAGTYQLRVVAVTHPTAPFNFTVTVVDS